MHECTRFVPFVAYGDDGHSAPRAEPGQPNAVLCRLHDHEGDDFELLEHPAPNDGLGDVVVLSDGREALVTARVEAEPGPLAALLEAVVAPASS